MWKYVARHEKRCERAKRLSLVLNLVHTWTAGFGDNPGVNKEPRAHTGHATPDRQLTSEPRTGRGR